MPFNLFDACTNAPGAPALFSSVEPDLLKGNAVARRVLTITASKEIGNHVERGQITGRDNKKPVKPSAISDRIHVISLAYKVAGLKKTFAQTSLPQTA
jgi:hypothetical protein